MIAYARNVAFFRPGRTALLFVLLVGATATEGITLLSLVPLIELIGAGGGDGGRLAAWTGALISEFGWTPNLREVLLIFIGAIILRALIVFLTAELTAGLSNAYLHDLRLQLFNAVTRARWSHLLSLPQAKLHQALSQAPYQLAHGLTVIVRIASSATLLAIGCGFALAVEPGLAGLVLACAAVLAVPMLVLSRLTLATAKADYEKVGALYGRIGAHLSNLKLNRFLGSAQGTGGFESVSRQDAQLLRRIARIDATGSFTNQIGGALLLAVMIGLFARLNATGTPLGPGNAVVLIVIFARIMPQAQTLFANIRQLAEILAPYRAHRELLARLRAAAEPERAPATAAREEPPEIRLEGVRFRYSEATAPVLVDIDMDLAAGSTNAVIGPSGAGKTTLADLVCGLLVPSKGVIRVDGAVLAERDFAGWRTDIGLVTQDEFLFPGSVRDNMILDSGHADMAIWQALDLTGMGERLRQRRLGLDTPVGERGERLSRGERQRICLARALIRKPKVLVLDEATSALNPVDEVAIIRQLTDLKGSMTVLIIAHRLSSVAHADRMFVLEAGRLAESGTVAELVNRSKSFANRMREAGLTPGELSLADTGMDQFGQRSRETLH